jgi:GT2 family glycosyltransferase
MREGTVSVVVLSWNSERFLVDCIDSVLAQTYPLVNLSVMDNDSSDDSVARVRSHYPEVPIIANESNLGFSGAHNRGIRETDGEFYMPLNPDVTLAPNYVTEMVKAAQSDETVGSVSGKLLNATWTDGALLPDGTIDSTGIWMSKTRRNGDRGIGELDSGQYDREEDIFGAAGAAPLYRRAMLEDVRSGDEYLDEAFFAYREEVDLAWRARWRGWRCRYVPRAIAYHARSYAPDTRSQQPVALRRLQYRNRYLMLIKNDALPNLLWHLPYLAATEILALGYLVLREREMLPCYVEVLDYLPEMLRKRRAIMAARCVSNREMRRWFRGLR